MRPEPVDRIVEPEVDNEAAAAEEEEEPAVKIEPVDATLELIGDAVAEEELAVPLAEADRETAEPELLEELTLTQ